jgi:mannose-6-phosphate isomerase-like protein (cupin superfamily)
MAVVRGGGWSDRFGQVGHGTPLAYWQIGQANWCYGNTAVSRLQTAIQEKHTVPLFLPAELVPTGKVDMATSTFSTSLVHGTSASLMLAERPGGYHSAPHTHPCEQLNLLQRGQLDVFCEGRAYHLEPGDVLRIPPDAVHWSWNRGQEPCVLVEVHAPGLQHDPLIADFAVGLFDEDEHAISAGRPINVFVDLPPEEVARIEALQPQTIA